MLAVWLCGNTLLSINEVTLRRACLVPVRIIIIIIIIIIINEKINVAFSQKNCKDT